MTTGARSGYLIPAAITGFCAAVLILAVSWFTHPGHAVLTGALTGAGGTAHVTAGPPWTVPPQASSRWTS